MTLPPFDDLQPIGDLRDMLIVAAAVVAFIIGLVALRLRKLH